MRILLAVLVLLLPLAGCASTAAPEVRVIEAATPAPLENDWFPGEVKKPLAGGSIARVGFTPSNMIYTIYKDGSGGLGTGDAAWGIDCTADAMTDARDCKITHQGLLIYYKSGAANPSSICLFKHDFPGRRGAIRADKQAAIDTDEDGCISGSHAASLAKASTITGRMYKWPYDYPVDEIYWAAGMSDAMALTLHIRSLAASGRF